MDCLLPQVSVGLYPNKELIQVSLYPSQDEIPVSLFAIGNMSPSDFFPNPLKKN